MAFEQEQRHEKIKRRRHSSDLNGVQKHRRWHSGAHANDSDVGRRLRLPAAEEMACELPGCPRARWWWPLQVTTRPQGKSWRRSARWTPTPEPRSSPRRRALGPTIASTEAAEVDKRTSHKARRRARHGCAASGGARRDAGHLLARRRARRELAAVGSRQKKQKRLGLCSFLAGKHRMSTPAGAFEGAELARSRPRGRRHAHERTTVTGSGWTPRAARLPVPGSASCARRECAADRAQLRHARAGRFRLGDVPVPCRRSRSRPSAPLARGLLLGFFGGIRSRKAPPPRTGCLCVWCRRLWARCGEAEVPRFYLRWNVEES